MKKKAIISSIIMIISIIFIIFIISKDKIIIENNDIGIIESAEIEEICMISDNKIPQQITIAPRMKS